MLLINVIVIIVILSNIVICYPHSNWRDHSKKKASFGSSFSYVRREDWNASASKGILVSSYKPVSMIMVKHTNTPHCYRKLACAKSVKKIQRQSMTDGFKDIQYNFLIDPKGNVFEGLGWYDLQTDHFDQKYRTIGFIGMTITPNQKQALTDLFEEALKYKFLKKKFHLCSTPDMALTMKNIKIDLEMEDMDNVNHKNITKKNLLKLKKDLSMENIECVMKTEDEE